MSTVFKAFQPAGPGEKFTSDAFKDDIGRRVPITVEGRPSNLFGQITGVDVADDGTCALFTIEIKGAEIL